ncbi:MAG: hypothetical protein RIQ33_1434 [Bacteroidota bacterium]
MGIISCQSSSSTSHTKMSKGFNPDQLPIGKVINNLAVHSNPSHLYSIYLPSKKIEKNKYNVVLFFDPHANGEPILLNYKYLAEKYSCILISSNSSQNGISVDESKIIANELIMEAINYYEADESKIVLCGFSGGAKVAIATALSNNAITKVIYCGAILPFQNCTHKLSMLGFAGIKDMNYADIISEGLLRNNSSVNNYCVEWNGTHSWPDSSTFEQAFSFINNDFLKLKLIKMDEPKMKMIESEQILHQQYMVDLQSKNENYWNLEIKKLNSAIDTSGLNTRLLGFISLMCYSISNQLLHQNNVNEAKRFLNIYKLADPKNLDCDYFLAIYYAKMNQPDGVYVALNSAIKNGFNDIKKIKSEPAFVNYLQEKQLQNLIASVKH